MSNIQNKYFEQDPKKYFDSLDAEKIEVKTPPPVNEVSTFCKGIYEWLERGVLNYDNERIILAAHDRGLLTNWPKKIFNQ